MKKFAVIFPILLGPCWIIGKSSFGNTLLYNLCFFGALLSMVVLYLLWLQFRPTGSLTEELLRLTPEERAELFEQHGMEPEASEKFVQSLAETEKIVSEALEKIDSKNSV